MEPKNELPPANYTPEEQAKLEKSRTISDAELLKGEAEYSVNENGEKVNLLATEEQIAFLEGKRAVSTLDVLKNVFPHIKDLSFEDPYNRIRRHASSELIQRIVNSVDKELYVTYRDNTYPNPDFRLWNSKPSIRDDGHADWTDNEHIALAQSSDKLSNFDLRALLNKINAKSVGIQQGGTELYIINS